jgi:CRP/FNR family transcriptional regulator
MDQQMNRPTKRTSSVLDYLPRAPLTEYAKGSVIYSEKCGSLYLVAFGRVKVSRVVADGHETAVRIVPPEGLFGECSLINADARERAISLDLVKVMAWSRSEIEHQIDKNSRLGLALLEEFALAISEMQDRLQTMATRKTLDRVMLSLLQLQRTLGVPQADGTMRMASLTQAVIAAHAGATREIVSAQMNRLRKLGMVRYSRDFIYVDCEAMERMLLNGVPPLRNFGSTLTAESGS